MENQFVEFTKEMKNDYTILVPNMLPIHFKLIIEVLKNYGYKAELLETMGKNIVESGLKYVHNDTCYPAILVIGQFIDALESGKYDPHKVALILFQTGGGCRASNYVSLLRKAIIKAGYGYIPVIGFSVGGIEKHSGFNLAPNVLFQMIYCAAYGDLLMNLVNQCKPYEKFKGDTDVLANIYTQKIVSSIRNDRFFFSKIKKNFAEITGAFEKIPMNRVNKIKVGIVGEIFVKYSPLGNNNLESFLLSEGAEVVCPGFLGFCLYTINASISDYKLYGMKKKAQPFMRIAYRFLESLENKVIDALEKSNIFDAPLHFDRVMKDASDYIGTGAQMGEGWLLPAEMIELNNRGVNNIVCTQPFGCLPNHIFGKGMMKPLKDKNPDLNIVAIDYDAGATKVNQENRIKLMLSGAARNKISEKEKYEKQTAVLI